MQLRRLIMALFGPVSLSLSLTCCALMPHPADLQLVSLAGKVGADAGAFFTELATKSDKDCAYAANATGYDHLAELAASLKLHIATSKASPALVVASDALLRTLADARAAHAAASAKVDDPNGACMAPGAIALNAAAIARASAAIAATQTVQGAQ
jgi:hypothetical protein